MTKSSCQWYSTLAFFLAATPLQAQAPVSFRNEVMAVLSRAGCNQGICHGNLNGRGGFKLSLRGQDVDFDRAALTRDSLGRRVNTQNPDASLLLLKATGQIGHEGGPRFALSSEEYRILRTWIAAGIPLDPPGAPTLKSLTVTPIEQYIVQPHDEVNMQVRATFSDSKTRDVSALAVFESTNPKIDVSRLGHVQSAEPGETTIVVRYLHLQATALLAFVPARTDFVGKKPPAYNYIDRHIYTRLQKLRLNPSGLCSDSDFLRRAHLDLAGLLPTPQETRKFFADARPGKRARLIDALLDRPEFADT